MINLPKISIVTTSFNQGEYLEESIRSVLDQGYPNCEYIIIDGGSTDGSKDIIKSYEKHLAYWVSEPDEGQSYALNKGFRYATGDYYLWVNSDDVLLPGVLHKVTKFLNDNEDIQWVSGDTIWINADSRIIHCSRLMSYSRFLANFGLLVVGGPSSFFSRKLFEKVGGFNNNLYFTMDVDLWWRFHESGFFYYHLPKYFMAFRFHLGSKTSASSFTIQGVDRKKEILLEDRKNEEQKRLEKKYGNIIILPFARSIYKCMQILNGNYMKAAFDLKKMRGLKWDEVFGFESTTCDESDM